MIIFLSHPTPTTQIYTLSLHDALPISSLEGDEHKPTAQPRASAKMHPMQSCATHPRRRHGRVIATTGLRWIHQSACSWSISRSEEHTSELQSQSNLVCRLLLEKKNKIT